MFVILNSAKNEPICIFATFLLDFDGFLALNKALLYPLYYYSPFYYTQLMTTLYENIYSSSYLCIHIVIGHDCNS